MMSINRYRYWIAALVFIIIVALCVLPLWGAVGSGDKAPAFILGSVDGKATIKLADHTNKPAILVFWASWCPHCQHEMPLLQKVYKQYKQKGLNVVGVSVDDSLKEAGTFIRNNKITFPNAFAGTDKGEKVISNYGIDKIPVIYILSKGGTIKAVHEGEVSISTIRKDLASLGIK